MLRYLLETFSVYFHILSAARGTSQDTIHYSILLVALHPISQHLLFYVFSNFLLQADDDAKSGCNRIESILNKGGHHNLHKIQNLSYPRNICKYHSLNDALCYHNFCSCTGSHGSSCSLNSQHRPRNKDHKGQQVSYSWNQPTYIPNLTMLFQI
jgi:hypothetical protein